MSAPLISVPPLPTPKPQAADPDDPDRPRPAPFAEIMRRLEAGQGAADVVADITVAACAARHANTRTVNERRTRAVERDLRLTAMQARDFPRRHVKALRSDRSDRMIDTMALRRAKRFVSEDVAADRTIVVFSGSEGTGKSLAAMWALLELGASDVRPAYLRAAKLEAMGRYDKDTRSIWEGATSLMLEDLGVESVDGKGNFLVLLDELVDLYWSDVRVLVVTTNVTFDAFRERYGDVREGADADTEADEIGGRLLSRLAGGGTWCNCQGPDLRQTQPMH